MRYEDFIVQLGPETPRGIQVRGACAAAGEARDRLALPAPAVELAARFASVVRGRTRPRNEAIGSRHVVPARPRFSVPTASEDGRGLGAALFDAVFGGAVGSLLTKALAGLDGDDHLGLRLRLQLDLKEEEQILLHALPWELLYKADTGEFLGLQRRTPVVRYLESPRAVKVRSRPERLRILALAPLPKDQPALDLSSERSDLETLARAVRGLEVRFVESPNLGALRRALVDSEIHVLHLMGHGELDPHTGRGVVCLEGAGGRTELVAARALTAVLQDFPSLRLVVLNACSTGRVGAGAGIDAFAGLAPALMRAGVPAVVAMQRPISDSAAVAFSKDFYRRLVAGDPVDAAVGEGRQAIHARAPESLEWAVPALFTRTPAGVLFGAAGDRHAPRCRLAGLDHLCAGNFQQAISELRHGIQADTDRGVPLVGLGVALARGRRLRRLPYRTACEMHRLFARGLETPDGRRLAAAALLALKLDYFEANSVREPPPGREEVLAALTEEASSSEDEERVLGCLSVSQTARTALAGAGLSEGRKP